LILQIHIKPCWQQPNLIVLERISQRWMDHAQKIPMLLFATLLNRILVNIIMMQL